MKKLVFTVVLMISVLVNGQSFKDEDIVVSFDEITNTYLVKFSNFDDEKSNIEISVEHYSIIKDYSGKTHTTKISTVKQKFGGVGEYLFGGEIHEGEYVITYSYTKNGKQKTIIKNKIINKKT